MPEKKFIHLRYPDGREQRLVAGAAGERVAAREEARGARRFEPGVPYSADDAEKAAKEQARHREGAKAARRSKPAAGAAKNAVSGTEKAS